MMSRVLIVLRLLFCVISLLVTTSKADSFFWPGGTFPNSTQINEACAGALQGSLSCLPDIMTFATTNSFRPLGNASYQAALCDAQCGQDLQQYIANVSASCSEDETPLSGLPATYLGNLALSTWNMTCLKDESDGQYCVDYFDSTFANSTTDSVMSDLPEAQLCVPCTYQLFQQMQRSPFSNYNEDLAEDWSRIQTKCQFTQRYPTGPQSQYIVSQVANFAAAGTIYPRGCFSGNTYTAQSKDTIQSIAASSSVATGTLITLNNLMPDGSNLMAGQSLCLPQTCPIYLVEKGDTCQEIATAHNVSYPQFVGYNPTIDARCTNLIPGRSVCVGPPGGRWIGTFIQSGRIAQASSGAMPLGTGAIGTTPSSGSIILSRTLKVARRLVTPTVAPTGLNGNTSLKRMLPRYPGEHLAYDDNVRKAEYGSSSL